MTRRFVLAAGGSALLMTSLAACKRGPDTAEPAPSSAVAPVQPTTGEPPGTMPPGTGPTTTPPVTEGAPIAESPDVALTAPVGVNLTDLQWRPGPDSLPPGSEIAVLEGTPPFSEPQSFTVALKLPRNYTIPPHQHLVTERVTVLDGRISVGHGPEVDRQAAKPITKGGVFLLPADHTHHVFTGSDETVIVLQSVGPWGIYYVDPKDDPRPTPVEKPRGFVSRFDAPIRPTTLNASEIAYAPAPPGMLPSGARMAVLDGDPAKNQNFVLRIKLPDGYRIPVHSHSVTDRFIVISGTLRFGAGETFERKALKPMKPGAIVIRPANEEHFAQARGETVFQVTGTGPFEIRWANPEEDPARQPGQQAAARP